MTRKEYFKNMNESTYGSVDPIQIAVKALEKEPCEDCVSRKALLDKKWDVPYDGKYIQVVDVGDIKELPSVTLARKKGHWIDHSDEGFVECSECGSATNCDGNIADLHFCFNCGVEMESEEMN